MENFNIFYLHLYFSSKCPLHNKTKPTLNESTRIWPVRWLKITTKNFMIIVFYKKTNLEYR